MFLGDGKGKSKLKVQYLEFCAAAYPSHRVSGFFVAGWLDSALRDRQAVRGGQRAHRGAAAGALHQPGGAAPGLRRRGGARTGASPPVFYDLGFRV